MTNALTLDGGGNWVETVKYKTINISSALSLSVHVRGKGGKRGVGSLRADVTICFAREAK